LGVPFSIGPEAVGVLQAAGGYKQLQLQLEVGSEGDPVLYAVKKVGVGFAIPDGPAPNQNPVLSGLTLDGTEWDEATPRAMTYGECADEKKEAVRLPSDGGTAGGGLFGGGARRDAGVVLLCNRDLAPVFDADQSQEYQALGLSGEVETQKERLRFSWFTEVGDYSRDNTAEIDPAIGAGPGDEGPPTRWREPVDQPGLVTFWVVVRDGRGGEAWYRRQLQY
jgi:hypothetical protein